MTVRSTTFLGGTAAHIRVGKVAHGLMNMTWVPNPVPDEQCFAAIKAGVDAMPAGTKMVLNSAEFYAMDHGTGNLELLARFFEKYPEYADRTFLSVKGGANLEKRAPDSSPENIKTSITKIVSALRGKKHVDLFECARVDPKYPIEETMRLLKTYVDEGLIGHIGLSECSAETLRRAHAVHPVAAVEIEVSPWSMEEETKKVLATTQELGVAVVAYSPLGRGFLTGELKSRSDLPEGDLRLNFSRFSEENFKHNLELVAALEAMAKKKGISVSTLTLAWVANLGPKVIPLPGSAKPHRVVENSHAADVKLSEEDNSEIWDIINAHEIKGRRYVDVDDKVLNLWG